MSGQNFRTSEIDRLGERLRKAVTDDDRRTLDAFRLSFQLLRDTLAAVKMIYTSVLAKMKSLVD